MESPSAFLISLYKYMESILVGAFKVKDGLFIGDKFAAQDLEFVVANKVTRIINCASRQVPNHWEPIGVHYLSFPWLDKDKQLLLDPQDKAFSVIYDFIEKGLDTGESVLVHSVNGLSRSACIILAYLLKKYNWSLYKSLEFLNTRRPDLRINNGFIAQLDSLEARLARVSKVPRTVHWDQETENTEEAVLRNTFLNSRLENTTDYHMERIEFSRNAAVIRWNEHNSEAINHNSKNRIEDGCVIIQSCLKGANKDMARVPVMNVQAIREKNRASRASFARASLEENQIQKIRASSARKESKAKNSEGKMAKTANEGEETTIENLPIGLVKHVRKNSKEPEAKLIRSKTAGQKRAPSPKNTVPWSKLFSSSKAITNNTGKKSNKPRL